ncbi:MAG: hypothetical protein KAJ19_18810, partial [Gammaproteobacteria bacterium]|nr:hypothetical protein [Gammaproteobacteria bacterium]
MFSAGDKVVCNEAVGNPFVVVGQEYIVKHERDNGEVSVHGTYGYFPASRFGLVLAAPVRGTEYRRVRDGDVFEVIRISRSRVYFRGTESFAQLEGFNDRYTPMESPDCAFHIGDHVRHNNETVGGYTIERLTQFKVHFEGTSYINRSDLNHNYTVVEPEPAPFEVGSAIIYTGPHPDGLIQVGEVYTVATRTMRRDGRWVVSVRDVGGYQAFSTDFRLATDEEAALKSNYSIGKIVRCMNNMGASSVVQGQLHTITEVMEGGRIRLETNRVYESRRFSVCMDQTPLRMLREGDVFRDQRGVYVIMANTNRAATFNQHMTPVLIQATQVWEQRNMTVRALPIGLHRMQLMGNMQDLPPLPEPRIILEGDVVEDHQRTYLFYLGRWSRFDRGTTPITLMNRVERSDSLRHCDAPYNAGRMTVVGNINATGVWRLGD